MIRAGPLLAAGWGDLVPILIVLAFVLIPAIGQLLTKLLEAPKEPAKPGRAGPGAGPAGPRRPRDAVEDEIGEFLRRAAERRAEQAGRPAQPPQRPRPPEAPPRRLVEAPQPIAPPAAAPLPGDRARAPVEVEVVEEVRLGEGVRRHVQQYLSTEQIAERTARLGAEVGQTDERLQSHLHEKFDHQVGRLGRLPADLSVPADEGAGDSVFASGEAMPATAAAGFAALLADADSLRQAVVLNEILQRPAERWL